MSFIIYDRKARLDDAYRELVRKQNAPINLRDMPKMMFEARVISMCAIEDQEQATEDQETTTTPYIPRLDMHPDQQIKQDLTIMAGVIAFMLVLWMCFSLCAQPDPHRDCALRITRGLSPHQGKLLTRGAPTYNHAAQWCSAHPDHDTMIERAKTWPTFPTH